MLEALMKTLSIQDTAYNKIVVESAVEWVNEHTTLEIKTSEDVSNAPKSVVLFILKYIDIVRRDKSIASESAQGLSQSFNTSQTLSMALYEVASELLSPFLLSSVTVNAGFSGWTYGS